MKRKPTRGDMIALLNHAAHETASALSTYHNDRQHDRAGEMERRLGALSKLCLEAAGRFPAPTRRSPWVPDA